MKKQYPTVVHESAKDHNTIIVSGGKIGEQIMLAPDDLLKACNGRYADIVMNSDNDDDEENAQTFDKKNIRLIVTDVDGTLVVFVIHCLKLKGWQIDWDTPST